MLNLDTSIGSDGAAVSKNQRVALCPLAWAVAGFLQQCRRERQTAVLFYTGPIEFLKPTIKQSTILLKFGQAVLNTQRPSSSL